MKCNIIHSTLGNRGREGLSGTLILSSMAADSKAFTPWKSNRSGEELGEHSQQHTLRLGKFLWHREAKRTRFTFEIVFTNDALYAINQKALSICSIYMNCQFGMPAISAC